MHLELSARLLLVRNLLGCPRFAGGLGQPYADRKLSSSQQVFRL